MSCESYKHILQGARIFNELPLEVRKSQNTADFKRKLNAHFDKRSSSFVRLCIMWSVCFFNTFDQFLLHIIFIFQIIFSQILINFFSLFLYTEHIFIEVIYFILDLIKPASSPKPRD